MRLPSAGRRQAGALLLLLATFGGCGDGTGPELLGSEIRIFLGSTAFDEQTIEVGDVVELSARVLDVTGKTLAGETVQWSSDAPEVATVNQNGVVEALAVGTVRIVARHAVGEDTARFNVAAGLTPNELSVCDAADAVEMAVGEVREFAGEEALPICLPGGASGAEYTLIALNTGLTAASTLRVQVHPLGLEDGSPGASLSLRAAAGTRPPMQDERFHHRLRSEISGRLEPRLRAGVDPDAFSLPSVQLAVDQTVSFNVETASSNGCTSPDRRGGRVRAVGTRAIAVADTLNPPNGFTQADYQGFVDFFSEEVWPLVTGTFGEPSDVDGNGRVLIFFTHAVNELDENSPENSGSYIGGFFFNRDLFATSSCEGSNAAEMFYMLVPDPGTRALFTRDFVGRTTRNVLVHEFQHLVNDSRRLHVNTAPVWEETWLNEGLSHIAEELMFYDEAGLQPELNLGPDALAGSEVAREAFIAFQLENVGRLTSFLRVAEHTSLMGADLLSTRGAAWYFLRYSADRYAGNEATLWHDLVNDPQSAGLANLREALGGDPMEWVQDWSTAVYMDDLEISADARYQIRSWNMRELYPALRTLGLSSSGQSYPLHVSRLHSGELRVMALSGGSAGYSRATVGAGEVGAIRHVVGTGTQSLLPPPSRLKVTVVRTD